MTHESSPQASNSELPDPAQAERAAGQSHLSRAQLDVLTEYVLRMDEEGLSLGLHNKYTGHMQAVSEGLGDDAMLGDVAVSGATVGAMTRNPDVTPTMIHSVMRDMVDRQGVPGEAMEEFARVQYANIEDPSALGINRRLSLSLDGLEDRQQRTGEDMSRARVALLSSGFAATQDFRLRVDIQGKLEAS